jgi:HSP20 family molecular chaperone IbpA
VGGNEMKMTICDPFFDSFFDCFNYDNKVSYYKEDDNLVFEAIVPGCSKEDLSVEIKNGILTLGCKKEKKGRSSKFSKSYYLFEQNEEMPEECKAELKDGILTVIVPNYYKQKESATKHIKIDIK